ncbi:AbiH family protein [Barnesiella sp. An22]|uniref:AbiH family protein n=1 Tax=Barnesiella sp. An22 TaxID=1965590 RepID=UPI000B3769A1|nr:AbiH family protein [Barnesiella sp. An22]OUO99672.1 hypothetical protein B5F38_02310 [Barnesiella sp. An22]
MSAIHRIILVGNGFDLAHGLATRYENFIDWYWEQYISKLKDCLINTYSDTLCSFTLKEAMYGDRWYQFLSPYNNKSFENKSGREIYEILKEQKETVSIEQTPFMNRICQSIESKGWVDIENEYYQALNHEYFECPEKLNKEFEIVKSKLVKYLTLVQSSNIDESIVKPALKEKILAPIRIDEIAIGARSQLVDFIRSRYFGEADGSYISIGEQLGWDKRAENIEAMNRFSRKWGDKIEEFGIESAIDSQDIPETLLSPIRLMLLNFNYTRTADLYLPQDKKLAYWFPIDHIHGQLNDPQSIIFGYGDELDDNYRNIVKLNNNEHLRNIKSIRYLETQNYRNMLAFIESAPYQVYIMGHSCGNSDRTLLNTLFEHKNCISIKPFYHRQEDGSDNYLEIVQNISRNFTDMKLMRDRVVNKTLCETL